MMAKQKQGRSFLQVPIDIGQKMAITLTWIGEEIRLNLLAQIFSPPDTDHIYNCKAGYFNPSCKGILSLNAKDPKVMGETLQILSNAFMDDFGSPIAGQKIFVYVASAEGASSDPIKRLATQDISLSSAHLQLFLPVYGRFTEIELPFFTAQELETMKVVAGVAVPRFWAALCIWQESNAEGKMEFKFKKLDQMTMEEPNGSEMCP